MPEPVGPVDLPQLREKFRELNQAIQEARQMASQLQAAPGDEALGNRLRELLLRLWPLFDEAVELFPTIFGHPFRAWWGHFRYLDNVLRRASWLARIAELGGVVRIPDTGEYLRPSRDELTEILRFAERWKEFLEQYLPLPTDDPSQDPAAPVRAKLRELDLLLTGLRTRIQENPDLSYEEIRQATELIVNVKYVALDRMPRILGQAFALWYTYLGSLKSDLDFGSRLLEEGNVREIVSFLEHLLAAKGFLESRLP